jgi:hypothetical protein
MQVRFGVQLPAARQSVTAAFLDQFKAHNDNLSKDLDELRREMRDLRVPANGNELGEVPDLQRRRAGRGFASSWAWSLISNQSPMGPSARLTSR